MNGRCLVWILLLLLFTGCMNATNASPNHIVEVRTAIPPDAVMPTPQPVMPIPYGLTYPTRQSSWTEADRLALRRELAMLQALDVNTVIQTFSSSLIGTGNETNWLIFLEEAERAEIRVIARLWPLTDEDGTAFDFEPAAEFLYVVGDHPALLAYLGLHEPLERFNSDQMRAFYDGMKEIAPAIPVAHYMGNMASFDNNIRFPGRHFSNGICDICIVWSTPAQIHNGEPYFDEALITNTVRDNRQLIDERAPESELWYMGQTYALQEHRDQLRMPAPNEMAQIFQIATDGGVDGFLWYPWLHGNYDQVLSSPGMEAQQEAVQQIYMEYLAAR